MDAIERKLLLMFDEVHGLPKGGSCYTEFDETMEGETIGINLMKDGNVCWTATKLDLLFDYLTRDM